VEDVNKNNLLNEIFEKQPPMMSRTLYKPQDATTFGGLKYKNPFKTGRTSEKLEIPE
jgi:hypothetical protein